MINTKKNSIIIAASILLFLIIGLASFQQQQQQQQLHHFAAYAGREGEACIDNDQSENTITITCDVSFRDVANTINDRMILEQLGNGEYLLNANLQVDDGATFSIGPNDITWLKITGTNGIVVYGKIQITGVKITSRSEER